ncbi:bifunctional riboflavin kinase/FAD synthetase [Actinomarinicola tropica]|uniref:Riboflavin biosynthesis protein n=1 Tax=Actinomarinicola tropica TaxID=2789776 RepID=A0A5Q2RNV0_9ACTN|nr:bifunctional riboflavin kinase/FAD synthetase [Actinomarinicola tropica]QGG94875.1 bifunctional riboflavin kinase/FAD synthetase [Actinomarinicola tropica]
MQVIRDNDPSPASIEGCAATIGVYDGVHLGHQAVIRTTQERAAALGVPMAVVTFDRHPATILRPENAPLLLTTLEQKLELLELAGVDCTFVVHFDEARSKEAAEDFVTEVLVGRLGARSIVVGEDFHFGHQRRGNVAMLRDMGAIHGFTVEGLDLLPSPTGATEPVSSTAIRRSLAGGDVAAAASMLGRSYELRGTVVQGDQRGRLLGFPTANVPVPTAMAIPADAVYAGWYIRPDGSRHAAAINLGRRPTFYEHADTSLLEAHLIDFSGDLYGEPARVEFVQLLRSEMRFDGVEALVAQLELDVAHAREVLGIS